MTTTVLFSDYNNTKISEAEKELPDTSGLVTRIVLNTKIGEFENKIPDHAKYITTQESVYCRKFCRKINTS